jgi:hypothetical protein
MPPLIFLTQHTFVIKIIIIQSFASSTSAGGAIGEEATGRCNWYGSFLINASGSECLMSLKDDPFLLIKEQQ